MKTLPVALQTHLESGTTTLAWCWRLTRNDGAVFGFTDHDLALTFDGTTFAPESGFTASEIRAGSDLSVDAQEVEGVLTSNTITETDILEVLLEVMGMGEESARIEVVLNDTPGQLAEITKIVKNHNVNILSVVTGKGTDPGKRACVLRLKTTELEEIKKEIAGEGFEVS